jgi:hypothetical protein
MAKVQQRVLAEDSQRDEEMMRVQQQKHDEGDVVIKELGDCDNPPRKIPYYCLNQYTLVIKQ